MVSPLHSSPEKPVVEPEIIDALALSEDQHVGILELRRPPHNFFDLAMITSLADGIEELEARGCRALVLCAEGDSFCAGADFNRSERAMREMPSSGLNPIYAQALRLFGNRCPIVAAVHGPAIGGGLGLALAADFRVGCDESRFSANFTRLGIHPGFGLSVTLPRLIGEQAAALLFYTGRRIDGREAQEVGLLDVRVDRSQVREEAMRLAQEFAVSAPLAVGSLRQTLRRGLVETLERAMELESELQYEHFVSQDFKEGVAAMTQRRAPQFVGK